ncbi:hypothetical protein VE04_06860 [Pseudogymnoascus sp. 24MN13]|nr:hypothetical protein VE04_06860 [Pseudogymnoascus sp. 24MN13]
MDGFGTVGTATSLLVQGFHLFRHISSARRFAESAGTSTALIAIEYFRFETWLQQSSLLGVDPVSGQVLVKESSLRRAILLAADLQSMTMDYDRVEAHVLMVISQVYQCLQKLQELRDKYSLRDDVAQDKTNIASTDTPILPTNAEIPGAGPLFQNSQVAAWLTEDQITRQRRVKTISFFRKVKFTWSFNDDMNDRDQVMSLLQTLKSCNDTLRECLPPEQQQATDRLVNMKALALSNSSSDLNGIGAAASAVEDELHRQLTQAMMIKARRVDDSSRRVTDKELQSVELESSAFSFERPDITASAVMPSRFLVQRVADSSNQMPSMILEWVNFPDSLPEDDLDLLRERIALLCLLLQTAGHPYFPALPLCSGFFQQSRVSFALIYQLPSFATPPRPPRSLYSILPRNKYSVEEEKHGSRGHRLPSLEQRYRLAVAVADGVLSLLSVEWMHKTITSHNVVLYDVSGQLDLASPQLLGFGLARRERSGERTIDLRDRSRSPGRFWQHPELRAAGEEHRRFEQRFDIFSLGVVLFEIGMWQDAHFHSSAGSSGSTGGGGVGDFRRRLLHVCAREMAHRMGEAYKTAVMACLDGDEIWTSGWGSVQSLERDEDDDMQDVDELQDGERPNLAELFYSHVYKILYACCQRGPSKGSS